MKNTLMIIAVILCTFNMDAQFQDLFSYVLTPTLCDQDNGSITITALPHALSGYPLPWYIEVMDSAGDDIYFEICFCNL